MVYSIRVEGFPRVKSRLDEAGIWPRRGFRSASAGWGALGIGGENVLELLVWLTVHGNEHAKP